MADSFNRRRFLAVFTTDDGRTFLPTAKRIWDLLLTERVECEPIGETASAVHAFETALAAASAQGQRLFSELLDQHRTWMTGERERARHGFEARRQAIGRLGLPAVREHRRKRLEADYQARLQTLAGAEHCTPDLNAVMLLRVGKPEGSSA